MCKRIFASQTSDTGDVPFYKIGTIGGKADAFISQALFEEYRDRYNFPQKGDVLISCAGTVGKTVVYDGQPAYFQDSNIVWVSNPKQLYINSFLRYILSRVDWRKLNTTTIIRIYNDNLRELAVNFPSVKEQEKIVGLLSLIDELIAIQSKIIERYQSLIRALYARMLGKMDGEKYALGQLVTIRKGQQVNGEFLAESGTYKVLNGGINPSGYLEEYNTPSGTISISEGGNSCGYVQFNSEPFWSGGHCYTLESNDEMVNYLFLYHYLKFKQADIMALRIGSGLPNVQKKDLEKFEVIIPDTQYQNKATSIFSILSEKIELEQYMLGVMNEQKAYLLRQLFI